MPTPPMPPDVSGIGPNWYVDSTWNSTIKTDVSQTQTAYTAALTAVNNYIPTYLTAKTNLKNFLDANTIANLAAQLTTATNNMNAKKAALDAAILALNANPGDLGLRAALLQAQNDLDAALIAQDTVQTALNTAKNTLTALRNTFNSAQLQYNQLLEELETAGLALLAASNAAVLHVDSGGDAALSQYALDLQGVMNKKLTLEETVSSNLDVLFNNADAARIAARSDFLAALNTFQSLQSDLNAARNTLQSLSDQVLYSQATVEINTAILALSQGKLAYDQAKLSDYQGDLAYATATGNPAAIAQAQANITATQALIIADQAAVTTAQANLTASQGTLTNLQSQFSNQLLLVNTKTADRDTAQINLKNKLAAYQNAIDIQIGLLNQAAVIMQKAPTDFLYALSQARKAATEAEQAFLIAAKANDEALHTQHFIDYPTVNPVVQAEIDALFANALSAIAGLNQQATQAANRVSIISQIDIPQLPASGRMSMTDLMKFIALVATLFSQLLREIRNADAVVNQLRLGAFAASGGAESDALGLQMAWANTLLAADTRYNIKVMADNAETTKKTADAVKFVLDNIDEINAVIEQLNEEIDDQNERGIEVIKALNSIIQIAADTLKLQLWSNHGQLDRLADQFENSVKALYASDPTKAPLLVVANALQAVIQDAKLVSTDLSTVPINYALLATHQAQLTASKATLSSHISSLPPLNATIQGDLTAFNQMINIITSDQTKLLNSIEKAQSYATKSLLTQFSGNASALSSFQEEFLTNITFFELENEPIPELQLIYANVTAVVAASNTIATDLDGQPVDLVALDLHKTALEDTLQILKQSLTPLPTDDAIFGIDFANIALSIQDIEDSISALEKYQNPSTATATTHPDLPGQATTPLLPLPTQLEHLPTIDPDVELPATIPTEDFVDDLPRDIQGQAPLPPPEDVKAANDIVHLLNQLIVPLLPRMQAAGIDITAISPIIDPIFIREYIEIREPSTFINFETMILIFLLIFIFIINAEFNKQQAQGTSLEKPETVFVSLAAMISNIHSTGAVSSTQGSAAGAGILGANLFSSAGNIGKALNAVMNSTMFTNYINDILSQAGLVGGLASLTQLPNSINNWSQMGLVQSDASNLLSDSTLTAAQQAALIAAIGELVNKANNVAELKVGVLGLLQATGPLKVNEEELQQLLALLLFLLQLIILLLAAVIAAAGRGDTNIDRILQAAFQAQGSDQLGQVAQDLQNLGVINLPAGIGPSNPTFTSTFVGSLRPALSTESRARFDSNIRTVFSDQGITLEEDMPIETAIDRALRNIEPDTAADIRRELNQAAFDEADRLRQEVISNENRRPSLMARLNEDARDQLAAIPSAERETIERAIVAASPTFASLRPEDRNIIILALLKGLISPSKAVELIDQLLREDALTSNPTIAVLLSLAIQRGDLQTRPSGTPGNEPGTPGQLSDVTRLIADSFRSWANQTDDKNFGESVAFLFADLIRNQTDFFAKSLSLILDPASTYVKNFSILTRDDSLPGSHSLISQIPIAG